LDPPSPAPDAASSGPSVPASGGVASPPGPWCARIYTHTERLHPDFPTALKIEGVGGANLNHIRTQNAPVKIQLRGQKSGFQEPDSNQELQDTMHLQMSSEDPVQGDCALDMVQDLLRSIYDSHNEWCQQHNQPDPGQIDPSVIRGVEWGAPPCGPGSAAMVASAPSVPGALPHEAALVSVPKASQIQQLDAPCIAPAGKADSFKGKGDFQGKGDGIGYMAKLEHRNDVGAFPNNGEGDSGAWGG